VSRAAPPELWTPRQRRVLLALICALAVFLVILRIRNPVYVSNPQPPVPSRAEEVEDRIDPNTADAETLAALPMIGLKRAEDIVAYRQQYVAEHPGQFAFSRPQDMLGIRGIGNGMLAQIQPYLIFPSQRPTTAGSPP